MRRTVERARRVSPSDPDLTAFERACKIAGWTLGALAFLTLTLPYVGGGELLTATLAFRQDLYVAPALLLIIFLAGHWARTAKGKNLLPDNPKLLVPVLLGLILLAGWAGHYLVFSGYELTRDEQMAAFDAAIFRKGQLLAPIPAAWRPIADALNLIFMLPVGGREFWISSYLPINAAWRAAVGWLADPALASPLLATFGGFCLWRVSRLLWPASATTQAACVLLYAGSSQMLITAMTAFSMSMHLALNMLWLWLFLADRRSTHLGAIIVGFFATGIHQPLFHPLFVLPFLYVLFEQKRWRLLGGYLVAYAVIGSFWLAWPLWISAHGTAPAVAIGGTAGVDFFQRLKTVLEASKGNVLWMMAANLLRFLCWEHPLLLPLAAVGTWSNFREQAICRALAIGFVLPILVMAVLLPWQGYGWGYRYLHPVLGSFVLLGTYGWNRLERSAIDLRPALVRTSVAAMFLIFPIFAIMTHSVFAASVQLRREFEASAADILIVDTAAVPYSDDLVINAPDLSNRPKTLLAYELKPGNLGTLCRLGSIAFVPGERLAPVAKVFGTKPSSRVTPGMQALMAAAPRSGCTIKSF